MVLRRSLIALLWVLQAALSQNAWSQAVNPCAFEELSKDDRLKIDRGETVRCELNDSRSAWPKVWVYRLVGAAADEAMGVFTDFDSQQTFVPAVKSSRSRVHAPRVWDVDYEVDVPIVSDEKYTSRITLSRSSDERIYRNDWVMVRADSTKYFEGSVQFEPYSQGRVLMSYYNFVVPGSGMARFVRGRAIQQTVDVANAMAKRTEEKVAKDPGYIQLRREFVRAQF